MKLYNFLFSALGILAINSAWAIPTETVAIDFEKSIYGPYYDLVVQYDFTANKANKVVCTFSHPSRTYIEYTYQNESRRIDWIGDGDEVELTQNGENSDSCTKRASTGFPQRGDLCITQMLSRVTSESGTFTIHVVTNDQAYLTCKYQ